MVLAASLAARRWGEAVGGWLVGLPLTSGPVAVFLALEQGPAFATDAAAASNAGVVAQAALSPIMRRWPRAGFWARSRPGPKAQRCASCDRTRETPRPGRAASAEASRGA